MDFQNKRAIYQAEREDKGNKYVMKEAIYFDKWVWYTSVSA